MRIIARAYIEAAIDRCVWAELEKILVHNPAKLFGFADA